MAKPADVIGGLLGTVFPGVEKDEGETFFLPKDIQAKLANRLNAVIDLPLFGENEEKAIFIKIVRSLDKNTFKFIPKQVLTVAFSGDKALPSEVLNAIRADLPAILAAAVPLPFVPPFVKQAIIGTFLNLLLTALGNKTTLQDLLNKNG
jgi:hypothetical protein